MEPLDWKALRENCAGDEGLVNEVLDLFRNEAGGMLADVGTAVKSGDPVTIKRAAHRLKGALVSLAAKPATEAAKALELAGSSSNLAAAPALFAQLEAELTRVLDTIARPHTA
jgi:two-component system sensor histidine kinase/response regulator